METLVVKVGGAAGVDLDAVCADVARLASTGHALVLVHGTSAAADALAARAGLQVRQLVSPSGHVSRYTDLEMIEIYVAAAGMMNKRVVSVLQRMGCNAIGLSGADGRLLVARRKAALRTVENGRQRVVRDDQSGQLEESNSELLRLLMAAGYVPVVAPVALGLEAELLNVDGDRAAALLAGALRASTLIILSNVPGLLAHYPDESSLIRTLLPADLEMAEQRADGRMKKKLLAAREALATGVTRVVLADSRQARPVQAALAGLGTVICEECPGADSGAWPSFEAHDGVEALLLPVSSSSSYDNAGRI
jgi:[amino group carrier protein]-L-2-aminoadipate 6-kinase